MQRKPKNDAYPHFLDEALWDPVGPLKRQASLTPLYVDRYAGPLTSGDSLSHRWWEIIGIFKGTGKLHAHTVIPLAPQTVLLVPAGCRHREEADFMDILWVGLRGGLLDRLERNRIIVIHGEEPLEWCERLWNRSERRFGPMGPELDGLALVALNQILCGTDRSRTPAASRIEEAAACLRRNFDRDLPLPDVARQFGYSEGHFYREFRRHAGTTPVKYLTAVRIRQAIHWLTHTRTNVGKIARLVGYRDPLYFSRVFRQATGHRPSDYRRPTPA